MIVAFEAFLGMGLEYIRLVCYFHRRYRHKHLFVRSFVRLCNLQRWIIDGTDWCFLVDLVLFCFWRLDWFGWFMQICNILWYVCIYMYRWPFGQICMEKETRSEEHTSHVFILLLKYRYLSPAWSQIEHRNHSWPHLQPSAQSFTLTLSITTTITAIPTPGSIRTDFR